MSEDEFAAAEDSHYSEVASVLSNQSSVELPGEDERLDTTSPRLRHATMDRPKRPPGTRRVGLGDGAWVARHVALGLVAGADVATPLTSPIQRPTPACTCPSAADKRQLS